MKRALVTGAGGQDGHYLTELLRAKGYSVMELQRAPRLLGSSGGTQSPEDPRTREPEDPTLLRRLIDEHPIEEIYNLAGPSFSPTSWDHPLETAEAAGLAVVRLLEIIRTSQRPIRLFQASSAEMFGDAEESPQDENTPMRPVTPYGAAKLYAHTMVGNYRRHYGLFACSGILFNHESPLRREEFVTRKVTLAAARIKHSLAHELRLGNLDATRDWSFAGDFVEAMWLMLQQDEPGDYVLASGERHSVRELCELAFARAGLDYRQFVVEDPQLYRRETFDRVGNAAKARARLGWKPTVSFREMIESMVDHDLQSLEESR